MRYVRYDIERVRLRVSQRIGADVHHKVRRTLLTMKEDVVSPIGSLDNNTAFRVTMRRYL